MSVAASDLRVYGTENMPVDDESTTGGAVDRAVRILGEVLPAADSVRVWSDATADEGGTVEISGLSSAGDPMAEELELDADISATGVETFRRVHSIVRPGSPAPVGTLTAYRASSTTVDEDSPAGQTVLRVAATTMFRAGMRVIVAPALPARREVRTVASVQAGASLTLTEALAHNHTAAFADPVHAVLAELAGTADAPDGEAVLESRALFVNAAAGGSPVVLYEKLFVRNDHPDDTLGAARVRLVEGPVHSSPATTVDADSPRGTTMLAVASTTGFTAGDIVVIGAGTARAETAEVASVTAGVGLVLASGLHSDHTAGQADTVRIGKVALGVATSAGDSGSVPDRTNPPSGIVFSGGAASVAGGAQEAGVAQGVWLRLSLPAGDGPFQGRIVLQHSGQTI